jgi:GNAT superfamily N-acetyltransferase
MTLLIWKHRVVKFVLVAMELSDALSPISEADIRETYLVAPRLGIDDTKTIFSFQVLERTADGTRVICQVSFRTDTGESVLDKELERWLCDNKNLLSRPGRARVVCRVKFYVRRNFQGSGLAEYILRQEEELFRRWGAKEIQVTAMDDGRWVWTRAKFGYGIPVVDFNLLQQAYKEWQRATNAPVIHRADTVADFPRDFLLSGATGFALFKRL